MVKTKSDLERELKVLKIFYVVLGVVATAVILFMGFMTIDKCDDCSFDVLVD